MIQALFLACAMSLPPSSFGSPMTVGHVRFIEMLANDKRDVRNRDQSSDYKVLWIGGNQFNALFLRAAKITSWRICSFAQRPTDIVASVFKLPIKRESMRVVIYCFGIPVEEFQAMRVLSEALFTLCDNGYFLFKDDTNGRFPRLLWKLGYERIPATWNDYSIYRKHKGIYGSKGKIYQIRGAA